ncbi:MAG TPA: ANTAR domain-containing protein [Beijerinckiaceae bacterium]|jgi:response regulator NasT
MIERGLTVAVVGPSRARAAVVEDGLRGSGVGKVVVIPDTADLLERLAAVNPDVVVIDLESPSRDLLEEMFQVSRSVGRPVAMFVDQSDPAMAQAAVDAGISAYVVDGLRPERVKAIVDVAILRFNAFARLERELSAVRGELADRKLVERAKGVLMKAKGIPEAEAYALLRRTAMNEKRKIAEIARALVTGAELLK